VGVRTPGIEAALSELVGDDPALGLGRTIRHRRFNWGIRINQMAA
jgi:hypothetical protein